MRITVFRSTILALSAGSALPSSPCAPDSSSVQTKEVTDAVHTECTCAALCHLLFPVSISENSLHSCRSGIVLLRWLQFSMRHHTLRFCFFGSHLPPPRP